MKKEEKNGETQVVQGVRLSWELISHEVEMQVCGGAKGE